MGISSLGSMAWPFRRLVEDNKGFVEAEVVVEVDAAPFEWPFDNGSTSL